MNKEFYITAAGKTGLSSKENDEVLSALRSARRESEIPELHYEYNKHPRIFGKDPVYLRPKSGSVKRTAVLVRKAIRKRFGNKYAVRLG